LNKLLTPESISELERNDAQFRMVIAQNLITMRGLLKRKDATWGQAKLAEFFDVSISTYKRWEEKGIDGVSLIFLGKYNMLFSMCCETAEIEAQAESEVASEMMYLFEKALEFLKKPTAMAKLKAKAKSQKPVKLS